MGKLGGPYFVTADMLPRQSEMEAVMQLLKSRHPMVSWDAKTRVWKCHRCQKSRRDARQLANKVCRK